jgi:hypothetical protein
MTEDFEQPAASASVPFSAAELAAIAAAPIRRVAAGELGIPWRPSADGMGRAIAAHHNEAKRAETKRAKRRSK